MTRHDWREAWLRTAGMWKRQQQERELAEELEFHRAMQMAKGKTAEEAKREFGGFEKWKEVCRDTVRWRWIEDLGRDLVLAVRMLRKSPVFTVVALVTLTLAIGANTAIFSLMNEVMLKALPVPNAKRLATLRIQPDENFGYSFSYPLLQAVEKRSSSVMTIFTYTGHTFKWQGAEGVEAVNGELVSGHYFSALGLKPQLGRWIEPHDDRPGAPDGMVVVISNRFWSSRLGSDPYIIGKPIKLSQGSFTVVGVMPKGFRGMNKDALPDVFVPFQLEPFVDAPFNSIASGYGDWWFFVGAHLNDGVSLQQANNFLRASSHQCFAEAIPGVEFQLNGHKARDMYLIAEPGEIGMSHLRVHFRKPLTVLMGLVLMVLLVACLNLATLLTARAASRGREISTRFALGASRSRLLRQLLTESLLLALSGTALGLAGSPALAGFLAAMLAPQHGPQSIAFQIQPDLTIFGFTALIAILATVLTGTLPAFRGTRSDVQGPIREGSSSIRGADRRRSWQSVLLVCEVALSLILVTGACLLGFSLVRLHNIPAGFDPKGLTYLTMNMDQQSKKGAELVGLYHELIQDLQRIPGVEVVSTALIVPLTGSFSSGDIRAQAGPQREAFRNAVAPGYFAAMRTPLLEGREFSWNDTEQTGKKVILNRSAAQLLFPNRKAIGQQVTSGNRGTSEVIGIVADAKYGSLKEAAPPTAYTSITQDAPEGASRTLLLRSKGSPGPIVVAAQKLVHRQVPEIPMPVAFNMDDTVAESLAAERMMAMLALFFGGLALLITGIGLYGTLAYKTERRTGEIGIRLALGARRGNVISLVCTENIAIALVGCLIGVAGSFAASRTIASFLYGVSAQDPVLFGAAAFALLAVATAASLLPAMKASKIDPVAAIRYE